MIVDGGQRRRDADAVRDLATGKVRKVEMRDVTTRELGLG